MLTFNDLDKPEDKARRVWTMYKPPRDSHNASTLMLNYVRNTIEEEGPFYGVNGASEGGSAATTVLLDQLELARSAGVPATMKCGIFSLPATRGCRKSLGKLDWIERYIFLRCLLIHHACSMLYKIWNISRQRASELSSQVL